MLRTCFLQIPSGYYIQTMNSNLHLSNLLLPIGTMNVISILPLLLLAPVIECVTTCYLSMEKTPLAPAKVISEYFSMCTRTKQASCSRLHLNIPVSLSALSCCDCSAAPSLITPPCTSSPYSSGPRLCHSVGAGGGFVRAAEEDLPSGGADSVWTGSAGVVHAVFPSGSSVHPARSGRGSRHPGM